VSEKTEAVTTRAGIASLPPDPAVRRTSRHRRPTGAPPPLPHPVSVTTRAWLVAAIVVRRTEGLALCGRGAACAG